MGKVGHPSKTLWVVSLLAVGLAIIIVWLLSFFLAPPLGLLWRRSDFVRGDFTFSQDSQWLGYRTFGEFVVRRTKDGREVWRKKLPGRFFSFCIPLPSKDLVAVYDRWRKFLEFWRLQERTMALGGNEGRDRPLPNR
jgi:hypothetical protein